MSIQSNTNRKILFVTGLSGAGISTSLKVLEDCGYEVFDNCPITHVPAIIKEEGYTDRSIAFGLDTRARAFSPDRILHLGKECNAEIIFLNATNASLQKRFSETRRVHPLAKDRTVVDGIIHERELLKPLFDNTNHLIDTSDLSVHDLKRMLEIHYALGDKEKRLAITIMSFAYKKGVPREVDIVYDARFLKNPHWDVRLRPLTGQHADVQSMINQDENFGVYFDKISKDIEWLIPRYVHEGKNYLTIAFGCTGGKHRSVYLAEKMHAFIKDLGYPVVLRHRDMPKT